MGLIVSSCAVPYFDYNATAPLIPAAQTAWIDAYRESWYNPASLYRPAARVRLRLDAARERVGDFLECEADRLVFTSGATEAAHGIARYLRASLPNDSQVLISPTEHPCVLAAFGQAFSGALRWLPLAESGAIDPGSVTALLDDTTRVVVIMAANNETGVIYPWREIARICRERRIAYVCDATQWLGKLPAAGLGLADWVFGAAHKFGGPKGCGLLIRSAAARNVELQGGGSQQRGHRGGTEDYPSVAAMVAALVEAEQSQVLREEERLLWRTQFERELTAALPGASIVARSADRLWNTVSAIMPHGQNTRWVTRLDRRGFQVSTGSACSSGQEGPSHVLAAMKVPAENALRVIRISSGWETPMTEWSSLVSAFRQVSDELRE